MINKLSVKNFKSFSELEVTLDKFNVLIGANASGKSNFMQIFGFLRDISRFGLSNAISLQGGVEYLCNIQLDRSHECGMKIVADDLFEFRTKINLNLVGIRTVKSEYEFSLKFSRKGGGFKILTDKLLLNCDIFQKLEDKKGGIKDGDHLGSGIIRWFKKGASLIVEVDFPKNLEITDEDIFPLAMREVRLLEKALLIERSVPLFPGTRLSCSDISIYDFDPKLPKKAVSISGKEELEEDGSNLSIVLKNIIEHPTKKRKFTNLIRDILPFIEDIDIEKIADKSLLFKMKETYAKNIFLPSFLISDGTINLVALLVAMYFEEKDIIIIEEPERNIHPFLLSRLMNMLKDVAEKKQVIVSSHNPLIVQHADPESLLLIMRDANGFSKIERPSNQEAVKVFLKNEIGIEELFIDNLLGV